MPGSRIWFALISSTAYFITRARPSPYSFKLWNHRQKKNKVEALLVRLLIHIGSETQLIGSLFLKDAILHNLLPFTADVVRLRPLAEVAGEVVDGKEPSEHNVPRQTKETSRNVVEPFRWTRTAAQSERPAQNQQSERSSHDADKPEPDTQVTRTACLCVTTSVVVCKLT